MERSVCWQIQTKGRGMIKQICSRRKFWGTFQCETDEESCDDEETEEVHWVKPSASRYLVDPRILEANMQTAAICKEFCLAVFPFFFLFSVLISKLSANSVPLYLSWEDKNMLLNYLPKYLTHVGNRRLDFSTWNAPDNALAKTAKKAIEYSRPP